MLLSNSRIFIALEDDKLHPVGRQEFNIARAHMVPFELYLEYVIVVLPFFITSELPKILIVSFVVVSVNKYKFFIDPSVVVTCKIK